MLNDPYRNMPPGPVPPGSAAGAPPRRRGRGWTTWRRADWERHAPLIAIGVGVLSLLLLLAVWHNRGTNRAARELEASRELVIEKRRQVEEARQLLEQRIAELRAAEAQVAAGAERLDVEMVRERTTETEAGEVAPLPGDPEARAVNGLRRGDSALQALPAGTRATVPPAYPQTAPARP